MALHLRDQIVDAVKTLLTGLTTTGARCYVDRDIDEEPIGAAELPALNIEQGDESSEAATISAPRTMQAFLDITVTGFSKLATGTLARKKLNLISQEVQVAMAGDRSLGGLCKYTTLMQTDFELSSQGEQPVGLVRMRYQVLYLYAENTPDVAQ